jgi:type I restriction enzyme, S subunit
MVSFSKYESYKDSGVEWLGEIPSHWKLKKNKFLISEKKDTVGKTSSNFTLLSLTLQGVIVRDMDNPHGKFPAEFNTYKIVAPNNLIFCLFDVEETPRTVGHANHNGMITGAYEIFECGNEIDSRYFYYYYLSLDFDKCLRSLYSGLRKVIKIDTFLSIKSPIPPIDEQKRIVEFLDRKTAEIDQAIEQKQRLIKLLKEQKAILIDRAVTKGLNPNVPMRDSGIDWIGEIPEHWDVKHVKHVSKFITSGPRGWAEYYTDEGSFFLQSGNLNNSMGIELQKANRIQPPNGAEGRRTRLRDNDVLVCITGANTGRVAIAKLDDEEIFINQHLCLIRSTEEIDPLFLSFCLHSSLGQTYFILSQYGLKEGLGLENIKNAFILKPSLNEQREISKFLSKNLSEFDKAEATILKQINYLNELKYIFIAEAVTGKLKI